MIFFKTEKEEQTAYTGQDRDTQPHGLESNYYDDGPSIMPASESFAGNQDNWGASADNWGGAGTAAAADTNEWSAANAANTGVSSNW